MYKLIKVTVILATVGILLVACSNDPEPAEVTQVVEEATQVVEEATQVVEVDTPVVAESLTNDFPQTLGYTQQPPAVDPAKGYFVDEIADGIFWLSGSFYQTMFLTTGEGVIVVDAPQSIGQSYLDAIQEVTDEPITHLIYSHSHGDHIGAAGMFPPNIEVIAHQDTANALSGVPAATTTFEDTYTLEVGNQRLELSYIGTLHSMGDIVIHAPRQKVAMVIDLFHPGSAPFAGFGNTVDLGSHLQAHNVLIEQYDFDLIVAGHTEILGTKAHLETNRDFIVSMQEIVEQAFDSVPSDEVMQLCIDQTIEAWRGKLDNLEDRVGSNCQVMGRYVLSQAAAPTEPTEESPSMSEPTIFSLPVRAGSRTRTSGTVPHVQIGVEPVAAINDELFRRSFTLPGVDDKPTIVSLPGARGMWLSDDIPVVNPQAIVNGREFAHIHTDGSLHAPLPYERALEVAEKGWGERHPWADERDGWEGLMMLYTPLSDEELEIIFQLIVESYNHVTGESVRASDFG